MKKILSIILILILSYNSQAQKTYTYVTKYQLDTAKINLRSSMSSSLAAKLNISDTTTKTWDWGDITGKPSIVLVSDSASMLANYVRRQELKDTAAAIRSAIGGGGGITTIGTINSLTKSANGGVISGSNLVLQTVDATYPGLMTTAMLTELYSNSYFKIGKRTSYDSLARFVNDSTIEIMSFQLVAGSNVTITPSHTDSTRSYTIAATGGGSLSDGDKGDVTVASGVWTIDNSVVTLAKMANLANNKVIGNVSGSSAAPSAVDAAIINLTSVANGDMLEYNSATSEWINKTKAQIFTSAGALTFRKALALSTLKL